MDTGSKTYDPGLIAEVIDTERISTLFQPVVRIDSKAITGFEAFSRGKLEHELIAPTDMFECGLTNDARLSLDALCCRQSLTRFRKFLRGYPWLCLFLNIDAAAVEHTDRTRHFLADLTRQSDIPPANIAVEVGADFIGSPPVWEFAQACRKDGYQLCVDKVCKKTPVLDILLTVRPEFVKLSPSLWADPDGSPLNRDNLRMIMRGCQAMNCLPIALGVETEEDALHLLQCDLCMQQGYYYTNTRKPAPGEGKPTGTDVSGFLGTIEHVHAKYMQLKKQAITEKRERFDARHKMMQRAANKFSALQPQEFEDALAGLMAGNEDVISAFVVDGEGRQITRRQPRDSALRTPKNRAAIHSIGLDHSMSDYHLHLIMGYERFVCPPSSSPFAAHATTLAATRFFTGLNRLNVLCVEFV